MSEAVWVQGLTKSYNGKTVVDHLDLSVPRGTVFGLLGANGAGKSTTIECILGTRQPDAGTVRLLGESPNKRRSALFQRIGVQFQEGDYQQEIKVSELCEETACLYRHPAASLPTAGSDPTGERQIASRRFPIGNCLRNRVWRSKSFLQCVQENGRYHSRRVC